MAVTTHRHSHVFQFVRSDSARPVGSGTIEFFAEVAQNATKVLHRRKINADLAFTGTEGDADTCVQTVSEPTSEVIEEVLSLARSGLRA